MTIKYAAEDRLPEDREPTHASAAVNDSAPVPPISDGASPAEQVQQALAESLKNEPLLAGLIESAMDAIVSIDENQRIVLFNPAAEQMFGLPAADVLGHPIELLLPENSRLHHAEHIRRFAASGVTSRALGAPGRVYGRRINGERFPVEAMISQVKLPGRHLFIVILRDISQRLHDEQALEEGRERLALSAATAFEGVVISEQGRILDCNDPFTRMLGYNSGELAGQLVASLVAPEDHDRMLENIRCARDGSAEHAMLRKDGTRIVVEVNARTIPVGLPNGRRYMAVRDITERKQTEQALRNSQAMLNRAQSVGQIGSWQLDIWSNQLNLSDENHRIFGIPKDAPLTYETFLACIHPDDREYVDRMWIQALQGMPYDVEHRLVVKGAVKWVRQRAELEFDRKGRLQGGFGTTQDITELKLAEQALLEADRRKDEFLAMLAHELRNPLVPILNAAHVLGRLQGAEPQVQWAQQVIERQVNHLTRLVEDLLDVSRISCGKIALKKEIVELSVVVKHALGMARPLIDCKGHRLHLSLPEQAVYLDGDPVRLAQVLLNLLDNAAKYTPNGGLIRLGASVDGPTLEISVSDNGVGISAELLPQIFELFRQGERTLDRSEGGLGVGLTLVKRLVKKHGGRLQASSAGAGQGATFTVSLPLRTDLSTPVTSPPVQPAPLAPVGCRVLVVDDDAAVADSMSVLLQIEGHEVRVAATGETAVKLARSFRPQLVLLDIGLQGMDGYAVARQLRAQQAADETVRLVAVTGYGDDATRDRSIEAGFDRHLVKPVSAETLGALLAEIGDAHAASASGGRT